MKRGSYILIVVLIILILLSPSVVISQTGYGDKKIIECELDADCPEGMLCIFDEIIFPTEKPKMPDVVSALTLMNKLSKPTTGLLHEIVKWEFLETSFLGPLLLAAGAQMSLMQIATSTTETEKGYEVILRYFYSEGKDFSEMAEIFDEFKNNGYSDVVAIKIKSQPPNPQYNSPVIAFYKLDDDKKVRRILETTNNPEKFKKLLKKYFQYDLDYENMGDWCEGWRPAKEEQPSLVPIEPPTEHESECILLYYPKDYDIESDIFGLLMKSQGLSLKEAAEIIKSSESTIKKYSQTFILMKKEKIIAIKTENTIEGLVQVMKEECGETGVSIVTKKGKCIDEDEIGEEIEIPEPEPPIEEPLPEEPPEPKPPEPPEPPQPLPGVIEYQAVLPPRIVVDEDSGFHTLESKSEIDKWTWDYAKSQNLNEQELYDLLKNAPLRVTFKTILSRTGRIFHGGPINTYDLQKGLLLLIDPENPNGFTQLRNEALHAMRGEVKKYPRYRLDLDPELKFDYQTDGIILVNMLNKVFKETIMKSQFTDIITIGGFMGVGGKKIKVGTLLDQSFMTISTDREENLEINIKVRDNNGNYHDVGTSKITGEKEKELFNRIFRGLLISVDPIQKDIPIQSYNVKYCNEKSRR